MTRLLLAVAAISRRADIRRRGAERVSEPHRPAQRVPARGHHGRGRPVLRRLDPDRSRVSRQPAHGQGRDPRPGGLRASGDRDEGRPRPPVRRGRLHRQRLRLRREDRFARHVLCASSGRLHRTTSSSRSGPRGSPTRRSPSSTACHSAPAGARPADVVHQREPERRLQPGFGVQRQRHRRDAERQDARLRPVEFGEALHHGRERCRPRDLARRRRERSRTATGSSSTGRRCTSCRTRWTWSPRSRSRSNLKSGRVVQRITDPPQPRLPDDDREAWEAASTR